jgi:hypothetical protein
MARRIKVYTLAEDGKAYWERRYRSGVEKGAKRYEESIPTMTENYKKWIEFVYDDLVKLAERLPSKDPAASPAENYARRGAPFAELFRKKGQAFAKTKVKVKVAAPVTPRARAVVELPPEFA